jgi:hypothetical protein
MGGVDAARTSPGVLFGRRRARLGFEEHLAIGRLLTSTSPFPVLHQLGRECPPSPGSASGDKRPVVQRLRAATGSLSASVPTQGLERKILDHLCGERRSGEPTGDDCLLPFGHV